MRITWRKTKSLQTHEAWLAEISAKDNQPERSAVTLARSWAGPTAVFGALEQNASTTPFACEAATVEAQTRFDEIPRGPRNHDLLLTGRIGDTRTVVSIESKVDETFGPTVREQLARADQTLDAGGNSDVRARVEGLFAALCPHRTLDEDRALDLRYQLFSGVAGTIAAAVDDRASRAVFVVHELVTAKYDEKVAAENGRDLFDFGTTVFDLEFPSQPPWCVGPLPFSGSNRLDRAIELFIAKARTDLRFEAPATA